MNSLLITIRRNAHLWHGFSTRAGSANRRHGLKTRATVLGLVLFSSAAAWGQDSTTQRSSQPQQSTTMPSRQRYSDRYGVLAQRNIFVRDRSSEPGCAGCIRITAGIVAHTDACLSALEEILCAVA